MSIPHSSEALLRKYFGHDSFRLNQAAIIQTVLSGQDVLAILPTGGGKSICYQIPGLQLGGTTLVISPLISLMKDQVDQLNRLQIAAAFLNSTMDEEAQQNFFTKFTSGLYQFVYVSPERLQNKSFLTACAKTPIRLVAIDEAHCVSQWGHDFRPAYLKIPAFLNSLPKRPRILALTATATSQIQKDIQLHLGMINPRIFQNSFARNNLSLLCHFCNLEAEKQLWLFKILLRHQGEKVIIYCATRAQTEEYSQIARHFGYSCLHYHAGMTSEERSQVQTQFTTGKVQMIAATNAFGMGIDIPDVRAVIHIQVPQDIEGYYQEIGRAGRDGADSTCYLLYTKHDLEIQRELFLRRYPPADEVAKVLHRIQQFCMDTSPQSESKILKMLRKSEPEIPLPRFIHILHVLEILGYIRVQSTLSHKQIRYFKKSNVALTNWTAQRTMTAKRISSVHQFLRSKSCRSASVLQYFGEDQKEKCQRCDSCLPAKFKISQIERKKRADIFQQFSREPKRYSRYFAGRVTWGVVKYLALLPKQNQTTISKIPGVGKGFLTTWGELFPI